MNRKVLLINLVFFLAIAGSILLIKQFMDTSADMPKKEKSRAPDAYMINAYYLRTNDTGNQDIVLFTPKVTHFPENDTSHFVDPKIFVFKKNEQWQISSKRATGVKGATTFYLYDDVKVRKVPNGQDAGTLLLTHSLVVYPKKNLVTTKEVVTIEQPGLKMKAIGLRGDMDTGKIQLLSKTRGYYDPNHSH